MKLQIEIFSDVICPWCFIGKRRLDKVLDSELGEGVSVRWRPHQLYPRIPAAGYDRAEYLARRYGPEADASKAPTRIREEAESEGIELRYDLIKRMPHTLAAHRLLDWAYDSGKQHDLADALFVAYFCEGRDVGNVAVLSEVVRAVGLDRSAARDYLESEAGAEAVEEQLARGLEVGVTGVPGYLFAGSFLLPGAQTSETMGQILERVKTKMTERAQS